MIQKAAVLPEAAADGAAVRVDLVAQAMLIRAVEERLLALFAQGKLFGTVHTCIGQEWSGVAVAAALRPGDLIFTNHRGHGHYLARTDDVEGLIGEVMGKVNGMCGGRGGSQHMCAPGVFSNGIQGGIVPVSAGLALSQVFGGRGHITAVFIGDGTLGEGVLYESLNIVSRWRLPLLVVLENNGYAQSTSQQQTLAGDICGRAEAFGVQSFLGSTWDVPELLATAAEAANFVRERRSPAFLRIDTYRLMPHSKGDDNRDPAEIQSYWARDPLVIFAREHAAEAVGLRERVQERVDAAVAAAEAAAFPEATPTTGDDAAATADAPAWTATHIANADRGVNLIHAALRRNMERDDRIVLLGEDIEAPYGGAFKVTKDLSVAFPGRVRNMPISEAAIVGVGNGLALGGIIPVCEIMFGDFLPLAADQLINHAAKFHYMYNRQVRVPLIVRTPMGGKRGYGPTHSQSLEKHFLGLPGTTMLALHHRFDPGVIYDRLLTDVDGPTLVIENKLLYGVTVSSEPISGFTWEHDSERFPTSRLRPSLRPDVTIVCYGGMLPDVEKAVEQLFDLHEIVCEIVCPTRLYPLDLRPMAASVGESGRLLIVEEGIGFAALGAEVIGALTEQAPGALRCVRRVAAPPHPIPSSGPLERALLPGTHHVVDAVREMMSHA